MPKSHRFSTDLGEFTIRLIPNSKADPDIQFELSDQTRKPPEAVTVIVDRQLAHAIAFSLISLLNEEY